MRLAMPRPCLLAFWLVCWMLAGLVPRAAGAAETVVGVGSNAVRVDQGVELLVEPAGPALTPDQAMAGTPQAGWSLYRGKKVNLARQTRPVWLRFEVRDGGTVPREWVLGVDWPLLGSVQFHHHDPRLGRWVAHDQGGLDTPPHIGAGGPFRDPAPQFALRLSPGERATVLLRVQSDQNLVVPLVVWDRATFQAARYDHGVVMGLMFGILGAMFLYNLSLLIFTRDTSFAWYSLYLLSIVLYELAVTGFGPLYLWGGSTWLKGHGYAFFASWSFLSASLFFRHFLDLRHRARHLDAINRVVVVAWLAMLPFTALQVPLAEPVALAMLLLGGLGTLAGIYTAVFLVLQGDVLARYFAIAWTTIMLATLATMLSLGGLIEGNRVVDYSQQIGFVIETVLLSIALAARIKRDKASKEAAQHEAMELARRLETEREDKLRAQEHALEVQRQANEALERRVRDRTAELERAMGSLELANVALARLSVTDALTQVHNRRYFDETLRKELDRSSRTGQPLALMMVDIDHFKRINDSLGHLAGDECLRLVAAALQRTVTRSNDLVARYGGEEFAVVLPATPADQAMEVAERLRHAVETLNFIAGGDRVAVTASLGVVSRVVPAQLSVDEFVADADAALYAAKAAGRNRVMQAP